VVTKQSELGSQAYPGVNMAWKPEQGHGGMAAIADDTVGMGRTSIFWKNDHIMHCCVATFSVICVTIGLGPLVSNMDTPGTSIHTHHT
jgi:hypothetical protein